MGDKIKKTSSMTCDGDVHQTILKPSGDLKLLCVICGAEACGRKTCKAKIKKLKSLVDKAVTVEGCFDIPSDGSRKKMSKSRKVENR